MKRDQPDGEFSDVRTAPLPLELFKSESGDGGLSSTFLGFIMRTRVRLQHPSESESVLVSGGS
jgi:hypothetical protein